MTYQTSNVNETKFRKYTLQTTLINTEAWKFTKPNNEECSCRNTILWVVQMAFESITNLQA